MDTNDRQVIEDLFARLGDAERRSGPRDAEAETLIRQRLAAQPAAPYYMAQTVVAQGHALRAAEALIAELEREAASRPAGGFLSGLFGGGRPRPAAHVPPASPPGFVQPAAPGAVPGHGGFLAGAAQTAMGVAGGVLLGNAVAGMLGSGAAGVADAATPAAVPPAPDAAAAGHEHVDAYADDEL